MVGDLQKEERKREMWRVIY